MTNMYDTPAGTGPEGHPYPAGITDPSSRSRTRRRLRWGVGITLAGFLAGGGIALALSSGTPGVSAADTASSASQVQGTTLNSALNTASSTSSAVPNRRVRWALGRLRLLGGVHGEVTFRYKGGYRTLAFERGTITSVSGGDVVVRAPDNTTWTWLIVSNTVVRRNGSKTTTSALSPGETVFTAGPVTNGTKDARLIVIRPSGSGSSSSGSSSSGSGSSSSGSVSGPGGTSVG
jgi:hypothetical protein